MQYWRRKLSGLALRLPRSESPPLPATDTSLRSLQPRTARRLAQIAQELSTTSAMLLHLLFALVAARLQRSRPHDDGSIMALACHVVTGREQHGSRMHGVVGCLDTSIPLFIDASPGDRLRQLASRTSHAFAEGVEHASVLPRGEFLRCAGREVSELFELLPHVNIVHNPLASDSGRLHALERQQQTRWGLLLRAHIANDGATQLSVLSEVPHVAAAASFCLSRLLGRLLQFESDAGAFAPLDELDAILQHARFATAQVARARVAATPADGGGDDEFIWRELIKRQQRWYEHVAAGHKAAGQLRRDAQNRFIATPRCPLPFSPVDKLAERRWCEARDVAQPRLLFTLTAPSELLAIAPQLPRSWVVKPVGAGHSDGVVVV